MNTLGFTLQDLSDRSGVSRYMLSQIERDEIKPTLQVACQIAEALNVSLSSLLGEHPEQEAIVIRKQQRLIYKDQQANLK